MKQYHQMSLGLLILITSLLTASCHTTHPKQPTTFDEIQNSLQEGIISNKFTTTTHRKLPAAVNAALLPPVSVQLPHSKHAEQKRFDVTVHQMPAKSFFTGLVEGTNYNVVVSPEVTGDITLNLKNVTIAQTLEAIHDVYGYEYRKTSYGFEILPSDLRTQIFAVNYLDIQRSGKSLTQSSSGQISEKLSTVSSGSGAATTSSSSTSHDQVPGTSIDTRSEMDFWRNLTETLKTMVGSEEGRSIVVNRQAGLVIVRAYPNELRAVARYLDNAQTSLKRQVILEAKILEVELKDGYQAGINWEIFGNPANGEGGATQNSFQNFTDTNLTDFSEMFALNVKGDFASLIKLLQTQGNVQVLSSPRIATVNNQKAVIKVGQDEFFVTGVSTSNTVSGNTSTPTQDVSLTPFFSGIVLDVTPQISSDDMVTLHIHPSVSTVQDQTKTIVLGSTQNNQANTLELPLALSTIRESDNVVRARDCQVIVIGGLMQNRRTEELASTPGAGNIPFFGTLFRRTKQASVKSELVILLRPIIANKHSWEDNLRNTSQSMQELKRGFHVGGIQELLGNEGELE